MLHHETEFSSNVLNDEKYLRNKIFLQNEVMKRLGRFVQSDEDENDAYEAWTKGGEASDSGKFSRLLAEKMSNDEHPITLAQLDKVGLGRLADEIAEAMKAAHLQ